MNCRGLHIAHDCQITMGCFSRISFQIQTGINPEKVCVRDHSSVTFIISKCSRAAVLDFRTEKASQFRKENTVTHEYQQEYLHEQDSPHTEEKSAKGLN